MIWKRTDAEFAKKTYRRIPLRSPRRRVSNPGTILTQTILEHRGTEITEDVPNQNSVPSVPLCFYSQSAIKEVLA